MNKQAEKQIEENTLLEKFMKEFFPFKELQKAGFFTKEMKGDYKSQAERVCFYFGYTTVYEYGSEEIRCHLSYAQGKRPLHINPEGELKEEPFITIIPNIYE